MLDLRELTIRYGVYTALDRVSFSVAAGEILGLVGPNGAGKTTLMRVVTTFLFPTAGRVTVAGHDVTQHPIEVRQASGTCRRPHRSTPASRSKST